MPTRIHSRAVRGTHGDGCCLKSHSRCRLFMQLAVSTGILHVWLNFMANTQDLTERLVRFTLTSHMYPNHHRPAFTLYVINT